MITLVATKFDDYVTGSITYGFRIYDEYGAYYDNNAESPIEDDFDLLRYVLQSDNKEIKAFMDFIEGEMVSININGQHYDWDEIKGVFAEFS